MYNVYLLVLCIRSFAFLDWLVDVYFCGYYMLDEFIKCAQKLFSTRVWCWPIIADILLLYVDHVQMIGLRTEKFVCENRLLFPISDEYYVSMYICICIFYCDSRTCIFCMYMLFVGFVQMVCRCDLNRSAEHSTFYANQVSSEAFMCFRHKKNH